MNNIFVRKTKAKTNIKKPKIFKIIKLLEKKRIQQNKKIPPIKTGELSILIIFFVMMIKHYL